MEAYPDKYQNPHQMKIPHWISVATQALPSLVVDVKPILFTVLKTRRILHTKNLTLPNILPITTFIPMTNTLNTD
jgi:hypothetical protein